MSELNLLIVEDEPAELFQLVDVAESVGFHCTSSETPKEALRLIQAQRFDLVMTDLHSGGKGELGILTEVKSRYPNSLVIIITGSSSVERAVEAMHKGVFHYLTKPYHTGEVRVLLQRARERCLMQFELAELREMVGSVQKSQIIGKTPRMQEIKKLISKVAPLDCTVLIEGETGTGKEFFAKLIHQNSTRADAGFLAVNCGAFSEGLLDNELFGHEKDAFTGATRLKQGLFETLNGGTIFLDEIGEMPLSAQVKLLRILQEKTLIRVGGTSEIAVDVRILAATNRDLNAEVEAGRFRKDLYYRLNVMPLTLPPLRERSDDIPLFYTYFLDHFAHKYGKTITGMSAEVQALLQGYTYPGNVRELINIIERAVILADGPVIERRHLPRRFQDKNLAAAPAPCGGFKPCSLAEAEAHHIRNVLEYAKGNKALAVQILGINRATLWRKLKQLPPLN